MTEAGITLYAEQGTRGANGLSCTATGPDGLVVIALAAVFLGFCSVVLFAILIFLRHRPNRIKAAAVRDGQPL